MDVYLIDFGTTRTNSGGAEVPRKGLRNISASGAMDLHVYLIRDYLGGRLTAAAYFAAQ